MQPGLVGFTKLIIWKKEKKNIDNETRTGEVFYVINKQAPHRTYFVNIFSALKQMSLS